MITPAGLIDYGAVHSVPTERRPHYRAAAMAGAVLQRTSIEFNGLIKRNFPIDEIAEAIEHETGAHQCAEAINDLLDAVVLTGALSECHPAMLSARAAVGRVNFPANMKYTDIATARILCASEYKST